MENRYTTVSMNQAGLITRMLESKSEVPVSQQRELRLSEREREIMQQRLANQMATGKRIKKLSPAERLKLRIQINRQLPEK